MNYKDVIKTLHLTKEEQIIDFGQIYPIDPIEDENISVTYLIDKEVQTLFMGTYYASQIIIKANKEMKIDIKIGKGYYVKKNEDFEQKFLSNRKWSGGDGIYSFNIKSGNDSFDQEKKSKSLFVFGDTFVGSSDPKTLHRFQPHLMPNNSLAYYENEVLDFKLNWKENGAISAFYEMDNQFDYEGPIESNLVIYHQKHELLSYLSGYDPKSLTITFDLHKKQTVSHMIISNYFSKESDTLAKRGLKEIRIQGSLDNKSFHDILSYELKMSTSNNDEETLNINQSYRYFRIKVETTHGLGNYNDEAFDEGLYGLNKVKFYNQSKLYKDIIVKASSVISKEKQNSWIWLQDGVIIDKNLYFLPLVVNSDQNQPEGLQFRITGVSLFKTPIEDDMIKPEKRIQKMAPLLINHKESEFIYGGAIMASTKQAGVLNPDGYVYIYGYKTTMGLREMVVARVLANDFEYFDSWQYFDGSKFVDDIRESKAILAHISCEFSVSPILKGLYKDKYLAVFTYDVNTPYLAYAIGDSPYGPFTKAQKIYHTPEQALYKSTTYTYNAKAHPHLSHSQKVLVSYNTNTYNFDHNMSNYLVYRPRFVYLNDTTK